MIVRRWFVFFGFTLSMLVVPSAVVAQAIPEFPPLEVKVPFPPTPLPAGGTNYLCYELHLTNYYPEMIAVTRVDVFAGSDTTSLVSYEGRELAENMRRPGTADQVEDRPHIAGGMLAFVYFWIPIEGNQSVPDTLTHRITFEKQGDGSTETSVIESKTPVRPASAAIRIGPPLKGGNWVAQNGPSNTSGHRRMIRPLLGEATVSQRYAIDYVKIDEQGRTFVGDRTINENHHAYGEEVIAVADAVVSSVTDGIPDNIPGQRMPDISATRMVGNSVVLDVGRGRYAFYAHFKPGSIRVKPGDRVRRSQLLGLVGNSGNSGGPHLHLHLHAGPAPLGFEGLPYIHDEFEWLGECQGRTCTAGPAEVRRDEIPVRNSILRFPN